MHRYFIHYRKLLHSSKLPGFVKRLLGRFGNRLLRLLFENRHERLALYPFSFKEGRVTFSLWLDWQDYTDAMHILQPVYEPANTAFMLQTIREGDVCLDIGANVGFFSHLMATAAPGTKVVALEPVGRNAAVIKKSLTTNKLTDRVYVETQALGKESGEMTIEHRLLNSGSGSIVGFKGNDPLLKEYLLSETVLVTTMSALWQKHQLGKVRICKIDIQGAELMVLQAATDILQKQQVEYFLIEYNDAFYGNEIVALLATYQYQPHRLLPDGTLEKLLPQPQLVNKQDYVFAVA